MTFGNELGMPDTLQDALASMCIPQTAFLSSLDSISAFQDPDVGDELDNDLGALFGEFAVMCVAVCKFSQRSSHLSFAEFDSFSLEELTTLFDSANVTDPLESANVADVVDSADVADPLDLADIVDADAFEDLTQGLVYSTAGLASPPVVSATPEEPVDPDDGDIMAMSGTSEMSDTMPTLIDTFPFGSAGAPVSNTPQGASGYGSSQLTSEETIWMPFWSQCNWEVAHWAKTCKATSSAVTRLLGIPGVCGNF